MQCGCGQPWVWREVYEIDEVTFLGQGDCSNCGSRFGVEAGAKEIDPLLANTIWTDEARHVLDRLPPYVEPLVREEVERYAQAKGTKIISFAILTESKNKGAITWSPAAERRLQNVPAAVQAMARLELERTAIDRGMPEVTVPLMEEVKARYFGMSPMKAQKEMG